MRVVRHVNRRQSNLIQLKLAVESTVSLKNGKCVQHLSWVARRLAPQLSETSFHMIALPSQLVRPESDQKRTRFKIIQLSKDIKTNKTFFNLPSEGANQCEFSIPSPPFLIFFFSTSHSFEVVAFYWRQLDQNGWSQL